MGAPLLLANSQIQAFRPILMNTKGASTGDGKTSLDFIALTVGTSLELRFRTTKFSFQSLTQTQTGGRILRFSLHLPAMTPGLMWSFHPIHRRLIQTHGSTTSNWTECNHRLSPYSRRASLHRFRTMLL